MLDIDKLIMEATKARNEVRKTVLRNLKSNIQAYKTSKNAQEYTDVIEIGIINKMIKSLQESIEIFKSNNREDLALENQAQLDILMEFKPQEASEEDIKKVLEEFGPIDKTKMGAAIKFVKEKLPSADGKKVSDIVKSKIA